MVDIELARSLLSYDAESGLFHWKVDRGGRTKAGAIAGSADSKGYIQIRLGEKMVLAHRLAWAFVFGDWPAGHLDHKDRNPKNNAVENLRLCTRVQNHQNTGVRADSTSGVTGVSWVKRNKKWLAYINHDGRRHRLGLYESKESAIAARLEAKRSLHDFHPYQDVPSA